MDDRFEQQFKKGALEMVLLALIARRRTYGYEIIQQLAKTGAPLFSATREGTLYPVLYRLEDAGLVTSQLDAPRAGEPKSIIRSRRRAWRRCNGGKHSGRATKPASTAFWRDEP